MAWLKFERDDQLFQYWWMDTSIETDYFFYTIPELLKRIKEAAGGA